MMGYRFEKTEEDGSKVTLELPHTEYTITDLDRSFYQFLRGCGFVFKDECDCEACVVEKQLSDLE